MMSQPLRLPDLSSRKIRSSSVPCLNRSPCCLVMSLLYAVDRSESSTDSYSLSTGASDPTLPRSGTDLIQVRAWMRSVPERGSVGSTVEFRPWMRSVPERGSVGSTVAFRPWMRSVPERGSVGSTVEFEAFVRNRSEEPQTFAHDVGRYLVVAVELSKRD